MADQLEQPSDLPNVVSDETGRYDARFLLWRKFCADHGIPVNSLPGDLSAEKKALWEKTKKGELGPK